MQSWASWGAVLSCVIVGCGGGVPAPSGEQESIAGAGRGGQGTSGGATGTTGGMASTTGGSAGQATGGAPGDDAGGTAGVSGAGQADAGRAGSGTAGRGGGGGATNCGGLPSSWTERTCYPRHAVPMWPGLGGSGGGGSAEAGAAGTAESACPPASEVQLVSPFGPVLGPELDGDRCCYSITRICG